MQKFRPVELLIVSTFCLALAGCGNQRLQQLQSSYDLKEETRQRLEDELYDYTAEANRLRREKEIHESAASKAKSEGNDDRFRSQTDAARDSHNRMIAMEERKNKSQAQVNKLNSEIEDFKRELNALK